ncbi:Fic family protein [Undibacterium sp.]|uniref:Fic family protein n=1 Tax=Undibacterium sp. TaxID=1914977 RepID=UPI0025DBFE62|nr:Fic family protein [Undibacterium sp.]
MKSAHTPLYIWQHAAWPRCHYDMQLLAAPLAEARQQLAVLAGKAQAIGLARNDLQFLRQDLLVQDAIATAAIEGQQLDVAQVRSSVMRKLGFNDAGSSARDIDGLIEVMFDASSNLDAALDADRVCRWQSALFPGGTSGIQRIQVGQFRSFTEPMQIISGRAGQEVVHYCAPESSRIATDMAVFLAWFNAPAEQTYHVDGIIRAAIAHLWFETIHPFEDGNGRIGRAIIDRALAQDLPTQQLGVAGLISMSGRLQQQRKAYYEALHQAQTGDLDITAWVCWFLELFAAACQHTQQAISQAMMKAQFWSEHLNSNSSNFNLRQRKTLQKLLDAGDGGFLGGMTAEKHSKITGASKATATRDLTELLQNGALISRGIGKATKYFINVNGWNQNA